MSTKAYFVGCMPEDLPDGGPRGRIYGPFPTHELAAQDLHEVEVEESSYPCENRHFITYGEGSVHVRVSRSNAGLVAYDYYEENQREIPHKCRHLFPNVRFEHVHS